MHGRIGKRYRRLHPSTGSVLRDHRTQTDLWPGVAVRAGRVRLVIRPDRPNDQNSGRRGGVDERYRRTRSDGLHLPDVALPDFTAALSNDVKGLKVGIPKEYFEKGLDADVEKAVQEGIKTLESMGMQTVEVSLPHTEYAVATYYILACAEASANLSRYDGVKYGYRSEHADNLMDMYTNTREEGFGEEVKRRILLGTFVLSSGYYDAYYLKGQKARTLIKLDFEEAYKKCDLMVGPIAPTPAFKLGEKLDDPLQMYLSDIFTISANLAGIPAMSIPCGQSPDHLPIGLQLMGNHFDEATLLNVAHQYQHATDHHLQHPVL